MSVPALLRGVDRAAFAVSLAQQLRGAGMVVGLTSVEALTRALAEQGSVGTRSAVYWTARVTLVRRHADLETFDAVFDAVFGASDLDLVSRQHQEAQSRTEAGDDALALTAGSRTVGAAGSGLPWVTLPSITGTGDCDEGQGVPLLLPSDVEALADVAFAELSEHDLALVGEWIMAALPQWPTRRSRRLRLGRRGSGVVLRSTMQRSRRTGWEPVELVRSRPKLKRRRVVMLCDVSASMRPYTCAYLHLMRAAALLAPTEVFAFSTRLTRLTAVLAHRSPQRAVELATERVTDRFGGTRIATNITTLLRSRHGMDVRGATMVIASDGWDSDDPEELGAAMMRLRRRAHSVIWVNPRAAAPGFAPLVGAMAAALPYCDELLPGHDLRSLAGVVAALTSSPRVVGNQGRHDAQPF